MRPAASILLGLSLTAMWLANQATLPLIPGFLVEGASAPTDEEEVRAASDRLMGAASAWLAAAVMVQIAPTRSASVLAAALVASNAHRLWHVLVIIAAWAGHVQGELAVYYWEGFVVGCTSFLFMCVAGARALAFYGIVEPCAALVADARALVHY